VAPAMAAEECTAVALYTLELLTDKKTWSEELQKEKKAVITNRPVHGYNASLYGVMNWVSRVYRTKQQEGYRRATEARSIIMSFQGEKECPIHSIKVTRRKSSWTQRAMM